MEDNSSVLSTAIGEGTNDPGFSLNPNPADGYAILHLSEMENTYQVSLYDVSGKPIRQYLFASGDNKIYTDALVNGIYFIQIKTSHKMIIKNLVVMYR